MLITFFKTAFILVNFSSSKCVSLFVKGSQTILSEITNGELHELITLLAMVAYVNYIFYDPASFII